MKRIIRRIVRKEAKATILSVFLREGTRWNEMEVYIDFYDSTSLGSS